MTTKLGSAVALAAATLAASGAARAVPLTGSFSNAQQPVEINQSGSLPLFNSSLGTLNSVTLTLSGPGSASFQIQNMEQVPVDAFAYVYVNIGWTSGLPGLDLSGRVLSLFMGTGSVLLGPGESRTVDGLSDLESISFAADPSLFLGAAGGSFSLNCTSSTFGASGGRTIDGGEGFPARLTTERTVSAGCGAQVAYDYTPNTSVPEPASLSLLGIGLLGAGVGARRARSTANDQARNRPRPQGPPDASGS